MGMGQTIDDEARQQVAERVRAFYDLHPYPPPVDDLDSYRRRWQDEGRRGSRWAAA